MVVSRRSTAPAGRCLLYGTCRLNQDILFQTAKLKIIPDKKRKNYNFGKNFRNFGKWEVQFRSNFVANLSS